MKRDIIVDVFLGALLLSILFVFSFPVLFTYEANLSREISLIERLMSVCFLLAFVLTGIWACWKKKIWVAVGLATYSILPYISKWFLPKVEESIAHNGRNIGKSLLSMFLHRIYEVTHAPFAGLTGMVSEKTAERMAYKLLPSIIIGYILAQIVHFYYKAYITEKKQKHDFAHFRRTQAHQIPAFAEAAPVVPEPLGTIIKDENDEIAEETYTMKPEQAPTTELRREETASPTIEATTVVPAIEATSSDTQVIALTATAPTSRLEEKTQVISLAATAPSSRPAEAETKVISLAAVAPTSNAEEPTSNVEEKKENVEEVVKRNKEENKELDFPDVHGEAEKIDVFGDSEP